MCFLDGSRSQQSWGFPEIHDFWATPGAILMGPQKKQVELIENLAHVLDIPQKKIRWLHSLILLEGSQNKLQMFMFSFLGGAVCQTAPSKY